MINTSRISRGGEGEGGRGWPKGSPSLMINTCRISRGGGKRQPFSHDKHMQDFEGGAKGSPSLMQDFEGERGEGEGPAKMQTVMGQNHYNPTSQTILQQQLF